MDWDAKDARLNPAGLRSTPDGAMLGRGGRLALPGGVEADAIKPVDAHTRLNPAGLRRTPDGARLGRGVRLALPGGVEADACRIPTRRSTQP